MTIAATTQGIPLFFGTHYSFVGSFNFPLLLSITGWSPELMAFLEQFGHNTKSEDNNTPKAIKTIRFMMTSKR